MSERLAELLRRARPTGSVTSFAGFVAQLGVTLTPGQRELTRVAFDGGQPTGALSRQLFGDALRIPDEARHVLVAVCGARGGKSYVLGGLRLLHQALTVPLTTLAPGEVAVGLIVAPDMRLARQALRYALGASKQLGVSIVQEGADGFTLQRADGHRVSIEGLPATRGGSALRGRSLVGAFGDEFAFFRDADSVVNDEEVFRAIGPRILRGGQFVIASTPWGESGLLYELFKANHGHPSTAIAAHAPTLLLRDDEHTQLYVARERQRDSDNAEREFDASFMALGTGQFFESVAIARAAAAYASTGKLGVTVAGADFGFRHDSSALVIAAHDGERVRVVEVAERRPEKGEPLKPSEVVADFAAVCKRHGVPAIMADGHYREAIAEHLAAHGLGFIAAPEGQNGKTDSYTVTRALLNEGRLALPEHERLLGQLRSVVSRPTPGGGLSISIPRTAAGHGDIVSALVLAAWQAAKLAPEADEVLTPITSLEYAQRQMDAHRERLQRRHANDYDWTGDYDG